MLNLRMCDKKEWNCELLSFIKLQCKHSSFIKTWSFFTRLSLSFQWPSRLTLFDYLIYSAPVTSISSYPTRSTILMMLKSTAKTLEVSYQPLMKSILKLSMVRYLTLDTGSASKWSLTIMGQLVTSWTGRSKEDKQAHLTNAGSTCVAFTNLWI